MQALMQGSVLAIMPLQQALHILSFKPPTLEYTFGYTFGYTDKTCFHSAPS